MKEKNVIIPARELVKVFEVLYQQTENIETCLDIMKREGIDKQTGGVDVASEIVAEMQEGLETLKDIIRNAEKEEDNKIVHIKALREGKPI